MYQTKQDTAYWQRLRRDFRACHHQFSGAYYAGALDKRIPSHVNINFKEYETSFLTQSKPEPVQPVAETQPTVRKKAVFTPEPFSPPQKKRPPAYHYPTIDDPKPALVEPVAVPKPVPKPHTTEPIQIPHEPAPVSMKPRRMDAIADLMCDIHPTVNGIVPDPKPAASPPRTAIRPRTPWVRGPIAPLPPKRKLKMVPPYIPVRRYCTTYLCNWETTEEGVKYCGCCGTLLKVQGGKQNENSNRKRLAS